MNVKMWPRKSTDRGGMLMLPLVENIPVGKEGWEKINCPMCGDECWLKPEAKEIINAASLSGAACTMCCIKASVNILREGKA
jgi:hypothetical protein